MLFTSLMNSWSAQRLTQNNKNIVQTKIVFKISPSYKLITQPVQTICEGTIFGTIEYI